LKEKVVKSLNNTVPEIEGKDSNETFSENKNNKKIGESILFVYLIRI